MDGERRALREAPMCGVRPRFADSYLQEAERATPDGWLCDLLIADARAPQQTSDVTPLSAAQLAARSAASE